MHIQDIAALIFLVFGLLAFLDGVYLHLWKYRLFAWRESRREHFIHTIRALLFPIIVYLLFGIQAMGWLLWAAVAIAGADLIAQAFDLYEEARARRSFGGLSSFEYSLHIWLTGLHAAALGLTLVARPAADWLMTAEFTRALDSSLAADIAWFFIPGSLLLAIAHIVLLHSFFLKGDNPPAEMLKKAENQTFDAVQ